MSQCLSPFQKKDTHELFPCGKCYECKARRVSAWSYRLMKEAERSSSALFLTLTYNSETVPLTENGLMTLCKNDVQLFFKKLRKKNGLKIKYYLCGEYGSKSYRPHYHVILFNCSMESLIGKRYSLQVCYGNLELDGKDEYYSETWAKGYITIGQLTDASCAYTLKYISKQSRIPMYKRDDRTPEFSLMSKRMGDNYFSTGHMELWHKSDILNRMYIPLKDGKKIAMPRYYKEKLYTKTQRQRIGNYYANQLEKQEKEKTEKQLKRDEDIRMAKGVKNNDKRNTIL